MSPSQLQQGRPHCDDNQPPEPALASQLGQEQRHKAQKQAGARGTCSLQK